MEESWYTDRVTLRTLLCTHPEWTQPEFARAIGRSVSWVKKWIKRLHAAPPDDATVLWGHSRARKRPPLRISQPVIDRILEIRDHPPAQLRRTPGPKAILYYLGQDETLRAQDCYVPRSTRTIWQILRDAGRIVSPGGRHQRPLDRPAPMTAWQLDFKDASTVPAAPEGKRQHVVEVLNTVDVGTSILLEAQPHADYVAETALEAVAHLVQRHGLPELITCDRDTRFIGSATQRDFPSAFVRFWLCLGVAVDVCPPHRPDRNAFVERYHRTFTEECLAVYRPTTLEQVAELTGRFQQHYNYERPNQALSCGNLPPRVAFPMLPARPAVPPLINPDGWLQYVDGRCYMRKIRTNGSITVDDVRYYIKRELAGQYVTLQIDAARCEMVVYHGQTELKRLAIKGLVGTALPFETFVQRLAAEARSERRRRQLREHYTRGRPGNG